MRCQRSFAVGARRRPPTRRRPTNSPHEVQASTFWTPAAAYADDYELADWMAGAD